MLNIIVLVGLTIFAPFRLFAVAEDKTSNDESVVNPPNADKDKQITTTPPKVNDRINVLPSEVDAPYSKQFCSKNSFAEAIKDCNEWLGTLKKAYYGKADKSVCRKISSNNKPACKYAAVGVMTLKK